MSLANSAALMVGSSDGTAAGAQYIFKLSSGGVLSIDGSGVTQPISAASLPLPSGAATGALQTTGNTSLGNIDTSASAINGKLPAALGAQLIAASLAVNLASDQNLPVKGAGFTPQKASITSASSGIVIAAISCVGMKSFNLVTNTTDTIVGAQLLTVEISPHDSDDVWVATALTITPNTTTGILVLGTLLSTIARRVRVKIAAAIVSGTFDIYLIAQGN